MQLKELLTDDDAVSPVIGVILMVAITVILAAVIAAFVLGLGDTSSQGPQVSFDYDYDSDASTLDIKVESGDTFTAERVSFSGDTGNGTSFTGQWNDASTDSNVQGGSQISAGDRAVRYPENDEFELEIVWSADDGDSSQILSERTGPDA